jgi:uncharacterized protein YjgD (DUF1641 family)
MDAGLSILTEKLDYLTEQFELQRRRQDDMNELIQDVIPVVNHMVKLSIKELAEVGNEFELNDLLFLFKRFLRDTRMLIKLLDQVETVAELADEGQKMGKRIFHQVTMELDRLEREGHFDFARAGGRVADRFIHEFKARDIDALGERMIAAIKTQPPKTISLPALARKFNDPAVKRGLFRMLNLLKAVGD